MTAPDIYRLERYLYVKLLIHPMPTLTIKLIDLAVRAGIRQKEVLEGRPHGHGTIRNDVPIAHGFRKFFTTQLVNAEVDVKTELRWLLEGHKLKGNDSHYVRTTEKRLQQEYEKAIDNLTIDPANRLRKQLETAKVEKSRLDRIEQKMNLMEKMFEK